MAGVIEDLTGRGARQPCSSSDVYVASASRLAGFREVFAPPPSPLRPVKFGRALGQVYHDIPLLVPQVDISVGLRHLFQRIGPINDWFQLACFSQLLQR